MSYSFVIKVKNGKLEAPEEVFHVPDGEFLLSGHMDDANGAHESLTVQRKDANGDVVVQMIGFHK